MKLKSKFSFTQLSRSALIVPAALMASGCIENLPDQNTQLVEIVDIAPSEQCPYGGSEVRTGKDTNNNTILESTEIQSSSYTCNSAENATFSAQAMHFITGEDETLAGQLIANSDQEVTFHASLQPFKGEVAINEDGSFVYTPDEDATGSDAFTYYINLNGVSSQKALVEIQITPINDAPTAEDHTFFAYNSTELKAQLEATDNESPNLTFALDGVAANGQAQITEQGEITYRANPGFIGTDSFAYSISDGELVSTATVFVNVSSSAISIPDAENKSYSIEQGVIQRENLVVSNHSNEAVLIWTMNWPEWYTLVSDVLSIPANSSMELAFDIDTRALNVGDYTGSISFTSAEPEMPTHLVDINLTVTEDQTPPAAIEDLRYELLEYNQVTLNWTAVADSGKRGLTASSQEIRYSTSPISEDNWSQANGVINQAPGQAEEMQSQTVPGLLQDTAYYFAIKTTDRNGLVSPISNLVAFVTPTPPVLQAPAQVNTSIKEGEEESFNVTLTNTGDSALRYSADLTIDTGTANNLKQGKAKSLANRPVLSSDSLEKHSGNIIIKMSPSNSVNNASFKSLLNQYKLDERLSIDALNLKVVEPQTKDSTEYVELINELNNQAEVQYAEPDYILSKSQLVNDPNFSVQWALDNNGQTSGTIDADIDAPEAWEVYTDASNIVVAVIDTGVDYNHEDLIANRWQNPLEIPDNGIDDDNNGYIDDVFGYDFANNDNDPMDDNAHGTHCAGIIAASGDNNIGIVGAAHTAQIMAVKFLGGGGGGNLSDAVSSIIYAVDNGANVLSNSWGGGGYSEALFEAINYANDNDVLFIAAAGNDSRNNDNSPAYPASYDVENVISVASSDHNDNLSSFSNYGLSVDLAAPGSDILSTTPGNTYQSFSGTSMATPYVSGAAALIRSNLPDLTALETKAILLNTVDPVDQLQGRVATAGRLNLLNSLTEAAQQAFVTMTNPGSGLVLPGESTELNLNVNAFGKLAQVYNNSLDLTTNIPGMTNISIPLNVEVLFDDHAPSRIGDLHSFDSSSNSIAIRWTNSGDDGLTGQASSVTIAYSTSNITEDNWQQANHIVLTNLQGPGDFQDYIINNLTTQTEYYIALKVRDNSGQFSELSNVINISTPVGPVANIIPPVDTAVVLPVGGTTSLPFTIENEGDRELNYSITTRVVEAAPVANATGPFDQFGYTWVDSDEAGVTFDWQDISSTGSSLNLGDDSITTALPLGFSFDFYGTLYENVYVSSNGFLTFTRSGSGCCTGLPIPAADSYNNLIAFAWSDLIQGSGTAHYQSLGNDFIVQFTNYHQFNNAENLTAQVILKNTGEIIIQYLNFSAGFSKTSITVGIENLDGSDGLQVARNQEYVKDNLAIKFTPPTQWISTDITSGNLTPLITDTVNINLDATELNPGMYHANIIINTNDSAATETIIPVSLEVQQPAPEPIPEPAPEPAPEPGA